MTHLATIGAGRWGFNWIKTLAAHPDVDLRWCADVTTSALERVRTEFPGVRTTSDVADVLSDPLVTGVVIATSAPTHYDVARRALAAGKHVLVEKPMTLTRREAVQLNRLAEEQGLTLMVGHLLEYHPAIVELKAMIDAGTLGEVETVTSQRLNLGTIRADENVWWSLAPHDISVACRLFGAPPVSVQCRGQCIVRPHVEDVVFATLEFPGKRLAHLHLSWLDPSKTRRLTVVGSRACAVFDDAAADKLQIFDKGFDRVQGPLGKPETIALRDRGFQSVAFDPAAPLVREAEHFLECIAHGARPRSDGNAGVVNVSVLEFGQQSLEHHGEVVDVMLPGFARRKQVTLR